MNTTQPPVERHPWPPYIPNGARYLFLGTFPPKPERWSMPFFYPNRINDFWRVMGLIFMNDRDALWDSGSLRFDLAAIKAFLDREHIALWDTAMAVRRLKDNASDKFLEIVEPINLVALLDAHPSITSVITTGDACLLAPWAPLLQGRATKPLPPVPVSACSLDMPSACSVFSWQPPGITDPGLLLG